jgi:hypothetical protein
MRKVILSFFDYTGEAVRPWAEQGFECHIFDIQHPEFLLVFDAIEEVGENGGTIQKHHADLSDPLYWERVARAYRDVAMVFGFPPCTDLAGSGARHWESKRRADPEFQAKAAEMALRVADLADRLGSPYCIENPVGALSTVWRKPDYRFDPCDFGGYLPEDDEHPRWPDYIPPRDAYNKRTCLWAGNGFRMPEPKPVDPIIISVGNKRGSTQWAKLGGKSQKTKNIRSATPRGFARAALEANGGPYA